MNRIARVVLALLVVLAFAASAFAQAPAAPRAPIVPNGPQATQPAAPATTPAAPTTAFTVASIVPISVVSAAAEYPKLVTLRGTNLDKVDPALLKLSDGNVDLTIALADQPTAKSASLTVTIPAAAKGEFVLWVDGIETKSKLVIKDAEQVEAERVEAARKRAEAAARAAAAKAAAEAKALKATVATLTTQVASLTQAVGTDNGTGSKIAGLESQNASLVARIAALENMMNQHTTTLNAVVPEVAAVKATVAADHRVLEMVAVNTVTKGKMNKDEKAMLRDLMVTAGMLIPEVKK